MQIILASSSPYRRALLERLALSFTCESPDLDEARGPGESPEAMVQRLSEAKAARIVERRPEALVIGSDQTAALGQDILGKPGDHPRAAAQLKMCSGRDVVFYTGLCLLGPGFRGIHLDRTRVQFRDLGPEEIERYLHREQPYQSAGSFKVEGLGISLFRSVHSEDPTALVGLPLIALCRLLRDAGIDVP